LSEPDKIEEKVLQDKTKIIYNYNEQSLQKINENTPKNIYNYNE